MPSTSCPGATTGRPGGDSGSDFSTCGWRAISRRIPSRREFPPMPAYAPPLARRRWRPAPLIRGSVALHLAAAGAALARPQWWPWALSAVVADHVLLGAVGLWPRSKLLGPNWTRLPEAGAGGAAAIAITFDDGPDPDVTQGVLGRLTRGLEARDILLLHDGRSARTTTGSAVILEVLPPLLAAIAAAGLTPVTLRAAADRAARSP